MRALIAEDGYSLGALAATRALAAGGWTVGIGSRYPRGLASSSSRCSRWHYVTPPEQSLAQFVNDVNSAIRLGGYDLVFGAGDAEVFALSSARDVVRAGVPYPPHDRVRRAFDKLDLVRAAERVGLQIPNTERGTDEALAHFDMPVVVKARVHWLPGAQIRSARIEASLCRTRAEASRCIRVITASGRDAIIQAYVPGRLVGVIAVAGPQGELLAVVHQEADRIWPPNIGSSARARTVPVDYEMATRVVALIRELEWDGLAQVEFLLPEQGRPHVTDFNGRFYGSMALAIGAGVNLPAIWANLVAGRLSAQVSGTTESTPGVRYQWPEGDLRRALTERRGGLFADVASCLSYARGAVPGIWNRQDPVPAIRYSAHLAAKAGVKLFAPLAPPPSIPPANEAPSHLARGKDRVRDEPIDDKLDARRSERTASPQERSRRAM